MPGIHGLLTFVGLGTKTDPEVSKFVQLSDLCCPPNKRTYFLLFFHRKILQEPLRSPNEHHSITNFQFAHADSPLTRYGKGDRSIFPQSFLLQRRIRELNQTALLSGPAAVLTVHELVVANV